MLLHTRLTPACKVVSSTRAPSVRRVQLMSASAPVQAVSQAVSGQFSAQLATAEVDGDWIKVVELLTEARALNVQLTPEAVESAVRALARGGQGVRAADLLVTLVNEGSTPSQPDTISRVFDSLVAAKQADKAEALLSVLRSREILSPGALAAAHNAVCRVLSRSDALRAYSMLETMITGKGKMRVEIETFSAVVNELIKAGEAEKAEEVLEWRDFLSEDE